MKTCADAAAKWCRRNPSSWIQTSATWKREKRRWLRDSQVQAEALLGARRVSQNRRRASVSALHLRNSAPRTASVLQTMHRALAHGVTTRSHHRQPRRLRAMAADESAMKDGGQEVNQ